MTPPVRKSPKAIQGEVVETVEATEIEEINLIQVTPKIAVRAKKPTDGQMAVISKSAAATMRGGSSAVALDVVFRVIAKLLIDEKDEKILDDALIDGEVTVSDLIKIFGQEDEDAAKQAPKSRVRRGK